MLPTVLGGALTVCIAASHLGAPSRVVVVPTTVSGDAPSTTAGKFDQAAGTAIAGAGAENASSPSGCANEKCASEAAGPGGYVLSTKVEVHGSDYVISTRLVDSAGTVVDEQSEPCEICSFDDASEALQEMVGKAVGPVAEAAPPPPPPPPSGDAVGAESSPPPPPVDDGGGMSPKTMGALGFAGIGVGVGALAGGVVMLVLNDRPVKSNCEGAQVDADGDCEFRYNTLGGGAGLAIGGAAALGVGIGLLILRKAKGGGGGGKVDVSASAGGFRLRF